MSQDLIVRRRSGIFTVDAVGKLKASVASNQAVPNVYRRARKVAEQRAAVAVIDHGVVDELDRSVGNLFMFDEHAGGVLVARSRPGSALRARTESGGVLVPGDDRAEDLGVGEVIDIDGIVYMHDAGQGNGTAGGLVSMPQSGNGSGGGGLPGSNKKFIR